jgi:hypothetical protein
MRRIVLIISVFFFIVLCGKDEEIQVKKDEAYYADKWCIEQEGKSEKRLKDGTICDCVTKTHAIEADWAQLPKIYEAVGQTAHYARMLKKEMGILLLVKEKKQMKYVKRLEDDIKYHGWKIKVWVIKAS